MKNSQILLNQSINDRNPSRISQNRGGSAIELVSKPFEINNLNI